jgi:hypothetical protein
MASYAASTGYGQHAALWLGVFLAGCALAFFALVGGTVLHRLARRSDTPDRLVDAQIRLGSVAGCVMFVNVIGAVQAKDSVHRVPPADTVAFLGLLAASIGIGAVLMWCVVLNRAPVSRYDKPGTWTQVMAGVATVPAVVTAVLAALGAGHILRLNLTQTIAWAYIGSAVAMAVFLGIAIIIAGVA